MSPGLRAHAEVVKLADLLGEPPARLADLEVLEPAALRAVRERATAALYDPDRERFGRIAALSRLPPAGVTATLARRVLGPLPAAGVAGQLDAARAADLARRLPAAFVADIAVELDPRRAGAIVARLEPQLVAALAAELGRREEYVTMGRFVGSLTDDGLRAALDALDEAALLRISYVLEERDRLDHIVGLLDDRAAGLLQAATEHDLWPEALDLLGALGPEQAGRLVTVAAAQDDAVLSALIRAAQRHDLWPALLPLAAGMSDPVRARFAAVAGLHDPAVLGAIVGAAAAGDLLLDLLPFVPLLPDEAQHALWPAVLAVAADLPAGRLHELAGAAVQMGLEELVRDVVHAAHDGNLWTGALRLLGVLDDDEQERLTGPASALPADERARAVANARDLGLLGELGPLRRALTGA